MIPRKPRAPIETGKKVPVNLDLERRIQNGRRKGLAAMYKRGERHAARVTTPEFRRGIEQMECKHPGCRRWRLDESTPFCSEHTDFIIDKGTIAVIAKA
jgi:hypothetical protein